MTREIYNGCKNSVCSLDQHKKITESLSSWAIAISTARVTGRTVLALGGSIDGWRQCRSLLCCFLFLLQLHLHYIVSGANTIHTLNTDVETESLENPLVSCIPDFLLKYSICILSFSMLELKIVHMGRVSRWFLTHAPGNPDLLSWSLSMSMLSLSTQK